MLSVRDELKCCTSYQLQPLRIATLHIDQWLHEHTALFLFAQTPTQRSAALLGIYLTHICALFKLTHTLAACDWAIVTMMKIKWTILSLSSSNLHSNSILPSLSPAVTLHAIPHKFSQIATAVNALKWSWGGRRAQKFRQLKTEWSLCWWFTPKCRYWYIWVCECLYSFHFGKCVVL